MVTSYNKLMEFPQVNVFNVINSMDVKLVVDHQHNVQAVFKAIILKDLNVYQKEI